MATAVGMNFKMTASIAKFQASMDKVESKLKNIERSGKQTANGMSLLAKIEVGKLLVGGLTKVFSIMKTGVSSVTSLAKEAAAAADAIGKLSASTGVAVEPLQVFQKVALDNGISGDKLGEALKRMTKRLAEAQQGFGEALPALERLGLNVEDLASMKPEQAFLKIGQAIGNLPQKGQQAAAAFKIFSDQGLSMVPMFKDMEKNIAATSKEMLSLGQILTGSQITAIEEMNNSFNDVFETAKKIGAQVLANFAPGIQKANENLLKFVKNFEYNGLQGGQAFVSFAADVLERVVQAMADAFDWFLNTFAGTAESIVGAIAMIADMGAQFAAFEWGADSQISIDLTNFSLKADHAATKLGNFESTVGQNVAELLALRPAVGDAAQAIHQFEQESKTIKWSDLTGGVGEVTQAVGSLGKYLPTFEDVAGGAGKALEAISNPADLVRAGMQSLDTGLVGVLSAVGMTKADLMELNYGTTALADVFSAGSQGISYGMDLLREGPRSAVQSVVGALDSLFGAVGLTREKMAELTQTVKFLNDVEKTELDKRMSQWDQWAAQQKDILKSLAGNPFAIESHFADMRKVYEAQEKQRLTWQRTQFNADLDRRAAIQQRIDDRMERMRTGNYKKSTDKFDTGFSAVFKTVGAFWEGLTGGDSVIDFPDLEETLPELKNQTTEIQNVAKAVTNMASNFLLASFP
jgi:hypothetical protein